MSVTSGKVIKSIFLHRNKDEDEDCSGECFSNALRKRDLKSLRRYFRELRYYDVECVIFVVNNIWKTLCVGHPRVQSQNTDIDGWVSFCVRKCGMVEGFLNLLEFYAEAGKSKHEEDLDFIRSNQKVSIPYYCLYSLSCIPLRDSVYARIFHNNFDQMYNVILSYLNNDFTWLEARGTCRLLQFIMMSDGEYTDGFINKLSEKVIISKMLEFIKTGYDITYTKLLQYRENRLEYQMHMIYRSTKGSQVDDDETTMQPRIWFYAFGWIRWCATFIDNLMTIDILGKHKYHKKIVRGLDKSGFYREFCELLEMQIDDDVDHYLVECATLTSLTRFGREMIMKSRNRPKKFFELVSELALGFMYRSHMCSIITNFLNDDMFFLDVAKLISNCLPYVMLYEQKLPEGESYFERTFEGSVGIIVSNFILKNKNKINSSKNDTLIQILNRAEKSKVLVRKRRKCMNDFKVSGSFTRRGPSLLLTKKSDITEDDVYFLPDLLLFLKTRISECIETGDSKNAFHYMNYIHSVEIPNYPILWKRNVYFTSKFVRLTELTYLHLEYKKYSEFQSMSGDEIHLFGLPFEDLDRFEEMYIRRAKWEQREGRIYRKYGKPSHLSNDFKKRYNTGKYPDPKPFVGIKQLDDKYCYHSDFRQKMKKKNRERKDYNKDQCCSVCGIIKLEGMKKCGRCKSVFYCSRECQVKDWKIHKKKCVKRATTKSNT